MLPTFTIFNYRFSTQSLLLAAIILLGLILRLTGIEWGLFTGYHHDSFMADESTMLKSLAMMNPARGDFYPDIAAWEGSNTYYLWYLIGFILQKSGVIHEFPFFVRGSEDASCMLLFGRLSVMLFDIASIFIVFLILKKLKCSQVASLTGAFIYAILPFEVIYSHYMRGHAVCNFFILLIFLKSLEVYLSGLTIKRAIVCGILIGLATNTRYTMVITSWFIFSMHFAHTFYVKKAQITFREILKTLFSKELWLAGIISAVTFLLLSVPLFLDYNPQIDKYFSMNFGGSYKLFGKEELQKFFKYFTYVIPYGSFLLIILFYSSVIYNLICKVKLPVTLSLVGFIFIFMYPMAINYPFLTVGSSMPVLAAMTLLSAIAIDDFINRFKYRRFLSGIVLSTLVFLLGLTTWFSFAYVDSMSSKNRIPYIALAEYLNKNLPQTPVDIEINYNSNFRYYSHLIYQIISPGTSGKLNIIYNDKDDSITSRSAHYLIALDYDYSNDKSMSREFKLRIDSLININDYHVEKIFRNEMCMAAYSFNYEAAPADMLPPFPIIYLFKKN